MSQNASASQSPSGARAPLRVSSDQLDALRATAIAAGHRVIRLDLAGCGDKESLLDAASKAFCFPEWFGRNWDALYDSLGDLSWLDAPGYLVVIENAGHLKHSAGEAWSQLCEILGEVASEYRAQGVIWLALEHATTAE